MATRRYGISRGESIGQVTESVGAATNADHMELTFDLAAGISTSEFLFMLRSIEQYILSGKWPPA